MKKIINKKTLLLLSLLLFLPLFSGCFLTPSVNQTPTITSTSITTATVKELYVYNVNATDPDSGDTLTYSLTTNPSGMTIDSTTGLINWTPTSAQIGNHNVTVEVSDGSLSDTQSFIIIVSKAPIIPPSPPPIINPPTNHAPTITSAPATLATVGVLYTYDVNATDPDGDTLTYSLTTSPDGMIINSTTGVISWTPNSSQIGDNYVTVEVSDGELSDAQSFTITPEIITPLDDEQKYTTMDQIGQSAMEYYEQNAPLVGEEEAKKVTIDWLKQQNEVADAGVSEDQTSIWIEFKGGLDGYLFFDAKYWVGEQSSGSAKFFKLPLSQPKEFTTVENKSVLLLAPYLWQFVTDLKYFQNLFNSIEYSTEYLYNESETDQNITVETFKTLDQYGVIIISTHGGAGSWNWAFPTAISSGEHTSWSKSAGIYRDDILNDRITPFIWIENVKGGYYGIRPKFFKYYLSQSSPGLIYMGACYGLRFSDMADAFNEKGYTYFGWDKSVYSGWNDSTSTALFSVMINQTKTTQEAFSAIQPEYGTDPVTGANLKFQGKEDLALVSEAPLKIAVTPPYYDDIGKILTNMKYIFTEIEPSDLSNYDLIKDYDIIFINCAGELEQPAQDAKTALQQFVQNGGNLYTSDWAFTFIQNSFPEYITFSGYIGEAQTVTFTVVEPGLQDYLWGGNVGEITYDLSSWVPIESISSQTKVYLTGSYSVYESMGSANIKSLRKREISKGQSKSSSTTETDKPLAVCFSYVNGKVIHTTFHNEAQLDWLIQRMLEYFIFELTS